MKSNFQLEQVNPLRGLNEERLIALQEQGMRGYYSLLMWTYFFFEKKDPIIRAVKRLLISSLAGLDWSIKQPEIDENDPDKAAKEELSNKQAAALRKEYDAVSNLRAALTFLALADLRGFSHCNKVYAGAIDPKTGEPFNPDLDPWTIIELRPVEQWFWAKNGFYGPWLYNREARETNTGAPIDLAHYVIHQVDDPFDEIASQMGVKRRVNDADWDGFLEDYGVPPLFVEMPPNVPPAKEAEYQRVAEEALSRARGAFPNGATLHSPSATGSGGVGIFAERLKYIDEQIVIAGTSGQLTILAESGSGNLAGGAQKEVFDDIAQAIANQIATVFHKQFDAPVLARLFPNDPVLAYFEFAKVDKQETKQVLEDAKTAADAGYRMDDDELSERAGTKLTFVGKQGASANNPPPKRLSEKGAPAAEQQPPITTAVAAAADPEQLNKLFTSALQQLSEAEAADLVPLRRALETASTDPTPEKLQALLDQLTTIQEQLGTRGEEVRAKILGTALASGLSS